MYTVYEIRCWRSKKFSPPSTAYSPNFIPQKILVLLGTFYQNRTDEASNLGKNSQKWAFQKIKALEKSGKKGPKSTKIFWGTK